MEKIKNALETILSDENLLMDFFEKFGTEIQSFFENREHLAENAVVEQPTEVVANGRQESTTSIEQVELVAEQTIESVKNATAIPQKELQVAEIEIKTIGVPAEELKSAETPINVKAENPPTDRRLGFDTLSDREKAKNDALVMEIKNLQITFSNGKVNQEYSVDFDIDSYKFRDTSIVAVEFDKLDDIGLHYFPEEKKIKGTPTKAGDYKVIMKFRIKGYESRSPLERQVTFIINPDPRVLWSKDIPTLKDIEYYKPDSDKKFEKVESKKESKFLGLKKIEITRKNMVAASQRGRSHAIEGKPRDDDFKLYFDKATEWYIMVVADGAGSAPYSRKGSQIACETAVEVCKLQIAEIGNLLEEQIGFYGEKKTEERKDVYEFLHQIVGKAAFEAYKKICEEAASKQRKPKEYATTLLISTCKKFEFGWFVGAFWVGDGGIGIYRKEPQELKILGEADGGEFAGQTRFLTMPEIFSDRVRTRFEIVEDFEAVILMTDGVTDPKFETDANLNRIEKWHTLWDDLNGNNEDNLKVNFSDNNEHTAEQLLNWLNFWSKGNHDDRTIAILF
jgi:serine/threonine protein phosphatase PrpC